MNSDVFEKFSIFKLYLKMNFIICRYLVNIFKSNKSINRNCFLKPKHIRIKENVND